MGAVDDHLRGVDVAGLQGALIGFLAIGGEFAAECIFPMEVVPICDMEGERDDVRVLRKLGEEFICGWAGGAALGGEELDDDGVFDCVCVQRCEARIQRVCPEERAKREDGNGDRIFNHHSFIR